MARHGGARPNAGRKKGAVAQAKRDLSELARGYAEEAVRVLIDVARNGDSAAARVSAANAILDRGYGKPVQGMELSGPDGGPLSVITRVELVAVDVDTQD